MPGNALLRMHHEQGTALIAKRGCAHMEAGQRDAADRTSEDR